jgi:hypothetical protein
MLSANVTLYGLTTTLSDWSAATALNKSTAKPFIPATAAVVFRPSALISTARCVITPKRNVNALSGCNVDVGRNPVVDSVDRVDGGDDSIDRPSDPHATMAATATGTTAIIDERRMSI